MSNFVVIAITAFFELVLLSIPYAIGELFTKKAHKQLWCILLQVFLTTILVVALVVTGDLREPKTYFQLVGVLFGIAAYLRLPKLGSPPHPGV